VLAFSQNVATICRPEETRMTDRLGPWAAPVIVALIVGVAAVLQGAALASLILGAVACRQAWGFLRFTTTLREADVTLDATARSE
jgi:hypothetical protein